MELVWLNFESLNRECPVWMAPALQGHFDGAGAKSGTVLCPALYEGLPDDSVQINNSNNSDSSFSLGIILGLFIGVAIGIVIILIIRQKHEE